MYKQNKYQSLTLPRGHPFRDFEAKHHMTGIYMSEPTSTALEIMRYAPKPYSGLLLTLPVLRQLLQKHYSGTLLVLGIFHVVTLSKYSLWFDRLSYYHLVHKVGSWRVTNSISVRQYIKILTRINFAHWMYISQYGLIRYLGWETVVELPNIKGSFPFSFCPTQTVRLQVWGLLPWLTISASNLMEMDSLFTHLQEITSLMPSNVIRTSSGLLSSCYSQNFLLHVTWPNMEMCPRSSFPATIYFRSNKRKLEGNLHLIKLHWFWNWN